MLDATHPSIIKYLLRTYHVQGTDLGTRDTIATKTAMIMALSDLKPLLDSCAKKHLSTYLPVYLVPHHLEFNLLIIQARHGRPFALPLLPLSYLQQPDI